MMDTGHTENQTMHQELNVSNNGPGMGSSQTEPQPFLVPNNFMNESKSLIYKLILGGECLDDKGNRIKFLSFII